MSISSFSLFESARKGLTANQAALTVVSQNVANASTDGYSRQEVLFKTSVSSVLDVQGSGVEIAGIRQIRDSYIEAQIRMQNEISAYQGMNQSYLEKIQLFLADNSDAGLRGLMDRLWKAAEDISNSPGSQSARQSMIQAGESFTEGVKYAASQISEIASAANAELKEKVDRLNALTERIASINTQISKLEKNGIQMNDLRDERVRLIDELSSLASISVSNSNGADDSVIVLNGHKLISGGVYDQLETDTDRKGNLILKWKSGSDAASSDVRVADAVVSPDASNAVYDLKIESLAEGSAVFSKSYNLNKNTLLAEAGIKSGRVSINGVEIMINASETTYGGFIDLINSSAAGVKAKMDSGGKLVLSSIETGSDSKIKLADMESNLFEKIGLISALTASPSPAISDAQASLNISGNFSVNGVKISIAQGQTDSLERIASEINSASGQVAAKAVRAADGSYSLNLSAKDGYSKIELKDETGNLLNRLGLLKSPQTEITIEPVSVFNGKNAVFMINNTRYSTRSNIVKDAIEGVELSLNSIGAAQIKSEPAVKGGEIGALLAVRDQTAPSYLEKISDFIKTFTSEFNSAHRSGFDLNGLSGQDFFDALNFASTEEPMKVINSFKVNSKISGDPSKIAAAALDEDYYSQTGLIRAKGTGDNGNALTLTALKSKSVFSDNSTIVEKYSEIVFKIGSEVEIAQKTNKTQKSILDNLVLKKESVSGVSLDEEISNMMKFQHAYNASARMINVIDGMLDTIINRLVS